MKRLPWLALLACAVALALAGCGGSDDDGNDRNTSAKQEAPGATDTGDQGEEVEDDAGEPTPLPDPVPEGELPPIQVTSPKAFEEVVGSFTLAGSAQVHEGALSWAILDAKLTPMVQGRMTASCGAPCRGKFSIPISLIKVPIGSWELHVWSPNVADEGPKRLHDTMVPITVATKRTPGAPAPGSEPPGGAPQP